MPSYIYFGLGAAIAIALSLILNKIVLAKFSANSLEYAFLFHAGGWIGAALLFFDPLSFSEMMQVVPFAVISAILWIAGDVFIFRGLGKLDASVVGSLFMFKLISTPIVAYFGIGEVFSTSIYLWMIPILVGGVIASYDEKLKLKSFFRPEVVLIMIGLCMFSITDISNRFALQFASGIGYAGFLSLVTALFAAIAFVVIRPQTRVTFALAQKFTILGGIVILVNLLLILGIAQNLTITNAIAMLNAPFLLLFTFFLSYVSPKLVEYHLPRIYAIRFAGAAIMYFSAVAIVFS